MRLSDFSINTDFQSIRSAGQYTFTIHIPKMALPKGESTIISNSFSLPSGTYLPVMKIKNTGPWAGSNIQKEGVFRFWTDNGSQTAGEDWLVRTHFVFENGKMTAITYGYTTNYDITVGPWDIIAAITLLDSPLF